MIGVVGSFYVWSKSLLISTEKNPENYDTSHSANEWRDMNAGG